MATPNIAVLGSRIAGRYPGRPETVGDTAGLPSRASVPSAVNSIGIHGTHPRSNNERGMTTIATIPGIRQVGSAIDCTPTVITSQRPSHGRSSAAKP